MIMAAAAGSRGERKGKVAFRRSQVNRDADQLISIGAQVETPAPTIVRPVSRTAGVIAPGKKFRWAGVDYTIRDPGDPLAPNGVPILFYPTGTT